MSIDLSQVPWTECDKGGKTFETVIMFKRISPLQSPRGKEEQYPVEVIICKQCNKVPKFFWDNVPSIPDEMKSQCSFAGKNDEDTTPKIILPNGGN